MLAFLQKGCKGEVRITLLTIMCVLVMCETSVLDHSTQPSEPESHPNSPS
jgi:hypothetical protein